LKHALEAVFGRTRNHVLLMCSDAFAGGGEYRGHTRRRHRKSPLSLRSWYGPPSERRPCGGRGQSALGLGRAWSRSSGQLRPQHGSRRGRAATSARSNRGRLGRCGRGPGSPSRRGCCPDAREVQRTG